METAKQPTNGAATATMQAPTITAIPDEITQPTQPERTTTQPKTERKQKTSLYDKVGRTGAYSGVIAIGALLWYVGAFYTLAALRSFGLNTASLLWWIVPVMITMIELWLMPKKAQNGLLLAAFGFVLLLDVGTSWQGLTSFAGKTLPLFGGVTLPVGGAALHITAAIIALVLAFLPEKIARAGFTELKKLWW